MKIALSVLMLLISGYSNSSHAANSYKSKLSVSNFVGEYVHRYKPIFVLEEELCKEYNLNWNTDGEFPICESPTFTTDSVVISPSKKNQVLVTVRTVGAGKECNFQGYGALRKSEVVAAQNISTGGRCQLTVGLTGKGVSVKPKTSQACEDICGVGQTLDISEAVKVR